MQLYTVVCEFLCLCFMMPLYLNTRSHYYSFHHHPCPVRLKLLPDVHWENDNSSVAPGFLQKYLLPGFRLFSSPQKKDSLFSIQISATEPSSWVSCQIFPSMFSQITVEECFWSENTRGCMLHYKPLENWNVYIYSYSSALLKNQVTSN